jgi:CubicO group peptidase (beta-lactamase class C family)
MDRWLGAALDYIPSWLEYQTQVAPHSGCLLAIVHHGKVVLERAYGDANLATGEKLTPRHRFRIASHSKSFTSAGIMKLREQRRLRLDDPVGNFVDGLDRKTARATLAQLLSHSAGLVRDGADAGQFDERRPYPDADQLKRDLASGPIIDASLRLKYSNHGYALLGLVIGAVTGEAYNGWIEREVVGAAGLKETKADMPLKRGTPFARGHSTDFLLGERLVIPSTYRTNTIAAAGGFVSTAADTARFFNQLAPTARHSILSAASRREMARPQWRNPHSSIEGHYGLGIMSGAIGGWPWFGHSGGLLGYVSRTVTLPAHDLTVSIMCNAADGWSGFWVDNAVNILRTFSTNGPPSRRVGGWKSRWWGSWGAFDLVPMGNKVLVGMPGMGHPFLDTSEIEVTGRDSGRISLANGYASHGETVRRVRNAAGRVTEVWIGGGRGVSRGRITAELTRRFGPSKKRKSRR